MAKGRPAVILWWMPLTLCFYLEDVSTERPHYSFYFLILRGDHYTIMSSSGGPSWDVPKGRIDGRISKASETMQ